MARLGLLYDEAEQDKNATGQLTRRVHVEPYPTSPHPTGPNRIEP
jgi:hypothetical protein